MNPIKEVWRSMLLNILNGRSYRLLGGGDAQCRSNICQFWKQSDLKTTQLGIIFCHPGANFSDATDFLSRSYHTCRVIMPLWKSIFVRKDKKQFGSIFR